MLYRTPTNNSLVHVKVQILCTLNHSKRVCELLLQHTCIEYDKSMIPGYRDLSQLVSYRSEVIDECYLPGKMTFEKEIQLRKCRGQFTGAEDNLLLRGVVSAVSTISRYLADGMDWAYNLGKHDTLLS